jgi:hypothetical protein
MLDSSYWAELERARPVDDLLVESWMASDQGAGYAQGPAVEKPRAPPPGGAGFGPAARPGGKAMAMGGSGRQKASRRAGPGPGPAQKMAQIQKHRPLSLQRSTAQRAELIRQRAAALLPRPAAPAPPPRPAAPAWKPAPAARGAAAGRCEECPFCGLRGSPGSAPAAQCHAAAGEHRVAPEPLNPDGTRQRQRRHQRKVKKRRQSWKMGAWWRKYGYSGERYCQRCSEIFRDHIICGFSNSCDCCRDSPCQDCSKILAHFPLDRVALWAVMDAGGGGGGKAPK